MYIVIYGAFLCKTHDKNPILKAISELETAAEIFFQVLQQTMRLKIVQAGEPVLRQTARPLIRQEILGDEIQRLIRDMKETMQDAPGVGLAAPQVGLSLQVAVIEDREET